MRALAHSPALFEYSPLATIHLSPRAPARRGPQSPVRARDLEIREGAPALADFEACRERAGSVPGACREHLETEVDPRPIAIARKGSLCRRSPRPPMTWRVTMLSPSGVMNACGTPELHHRVHAGDAERCGCWLFGSDGGVFDFGDAPNLGSLRETPLDQPIDGGAGFWTVRSGGESGLNPACVARASQADGA